MTPIVVFAPNWLGDAVMALPAVADVQGGRPGVAIDVAARPSIAPLFSMMPGVREVLVTDDRRSAVQALGARGYGTAILLPNSFNVALIAWRAGIPERWGYRADFRGPLLTRSVSVPVRVHQAEYYQRLVRSLGFVSGRLEPQLVAADDVRARGAELLCAGGWDARSPLIAIAPGAAYGGAKRWPARYFAELASNLAADGVIPVLVGSAGDTAAGVQVMSALKTGVRATNLIGRTDLPMLAGVLVHCHGLVTNDSGAMHFAAALGVNVTAMFGPTNERETRPRGPGRHVVLTNDVWCRPCMLRECPLTHQCMRGISVGRVRDAVAESL